MKMDFSFGIYIERIFYSTVAVKISHIEFENRKILEIKADKRVWDFEEDLFCFIFTVVIFHFHSVNNILLLTRIVLKRSFNKYTT